MIVHLVPASVAMASFFPEATDVSRFFRIHSKPDQAKAIVVEGDLAIPGKALVRTDEMFPDLTSGLDKGAILAAIIVTGNVDAPATVLMEPYIDRSPRLKVLGNVRVRSLILGGSDSKIAGDLVVTDTLFGVYHLGQLRVGGKTRAKLVFAADYEIEFLRGLDCRYALSWDGRMNIPIDFARDRLDLVLVPEVIDETNCPRDEEIIERLSRGKTIIRPRRRIGSAPNPKLSHPGKERLAALTPRAKAGETITAIDLRECELGFVPKEIGQFPHLRAQRLSRSEAKVLPDWIGERAGLQIPEAANRTMSSIPASIAESEIVDAASGAGTYPILEHLWVGGGYGSAHMTFVGGLDLADFPVPRRAGQEFHGMPDVDYLADADCWNAPRLEYLGFDAVWTTTVPAGLAKAAGLKGLSCGLTRQSLRSALDLLPRVAHLEILSLECRSKLGRADLQALSNALPGVHIRIKSCDDLKVGIDDPRYALRRKIGCADSYDEAAAAAEQLFADMNFAKPRFEAEFQESAMKGWLRTLTDVAARERDPEERRNKVLRAARWADRILDALPKTPDLCWLVHFRDLGLLRFDCLLPRANRHIHQPSPESGPPNALLDRAQAEMDRHVARYPHWRGQLAAAIGALRATIAK